MAERCPLNLSGAIPNSSGLLLQEGKTGHQVRKADDLARFDRLDRHAPGFGGRFLPEANHEGLIDFRASVVRLRHFASLAVLDALRGVGEIPDSAEQICHQIGHAGLTAIDRFWRRTQSKPRIRVKIVTKRAPDRFKRESVRLTDRVRME